MTDHASESSSSSDSEPEVADKRTVVDERRARANFRFSMSTASDSILLDVEPRCRGGLWRLPAELRRAVVCTLVTDRLPVGRAGDRWRRSRRRCMLASPRPRAPPRPRGLGTFENSHFGIACQSRESLRATRLRHMVRYQQIHSNTCNIFPFLFSPQNSKVPNQLRA